MLDLYKADIHPEIVSMIHSDTFAELLLYTKYGDYIESSFIKDDIKRAFDEKKLVEFIKEFIESGKSIYDL